MSNILKKISIDDLIILLSQMRRETTFVDMEITADNVLLVRPTSAPVKKAQKNDELPNNLNQLLG